jgi:hypothetical protein
MYFQDDCLWVSPEEKEDDKNFFITLRIAEKRLHKSCFVFLSESVTLECNSNAHYTVAGPWEGLKIRGSPLVEIGLTDLPKSVCNGTLGTPRDDTPAV